MSGRTRTRTAGKDHDLLCDLKQVFGTYKSAHVKLELYQKGIPQDEFYRFTRGYGKPEQVEIIRTKFAAYQARMEHAFALDPTQDRRKMAMIGFHVRAKLRQQGVDPARLETLLMAGDDPEQGAIRDALWWLISHDDPEQADARVRVCAR